MTAERKDELMEDMQQSSSESIYISYIPLECILQAFAPTRPDDQSHYLNISWKRANRPAGFTRSSVMHD